MSEWHLLQCNYKYSAVAWEKRNWKLPVISNVSGVSSLWIGFVMTRQQILSPSASWIWPVFLLLIWSSPVDGLYCYLLRSCQAVPSLFGASLEVAHPRSVRSTSAISELGPWPAELLRPSLTPRTPLMKWAALSHCVCLCLFTKGWTKSCSVSLQHTLGYSHFRWEASHLCFYKYFTLQRSCNGFAFLISINPSLYMNWYSDQVC